MAMRDGNFAGTGPVLYDPLTGAAERDRARTVCVRELSGLTSTADPRFDSCNYIPGQPHQSDFAESPEQAGRTDAAGIHEQLFRDQQLRH
jgi:hypothetical protein